MDICYYSVVRSGIYNSNSSINVPEEAVEVPIIKDQIFEERVRHYEKLQLITHHNIVPLLQICSEGDHPKVVYWSAAKGDADEGCDDDGIVGFGSVANSMHRPFFAGSLFYNSLDNTNFKLYIRDVLGGLAELHKRGLYHGNLSLETIFYYHRKGADEPVIKLGGFQYRQGSKMELIFKDFHDLGCSIELLMSQYRNWTSEREFVEIKDLCDSLKMKHLGLNIKIHRLHAVQVAELCQEFALGHVALLHHEERPSYIMAGVAHLESKKLTDKIKYEDIIFPGEELSIDSKILPTVIRLGGIPRDIKDIPDDKKGYYYTKLVRNEVTHEPTVKNSKIHGIIGGTAVEIEHYFRKQQPKVVLALQKALCETEFKFKSFLDP